MTDHVEFVETVEWDISADHLQHNYNGISTTQAFEQLHRHLV